MLVVADCAKPRTRLAPNARTLHRSSSPRAAGPRGDPSNALARRLLPAIRSHFESDEGKAAFTEWKSWQVAEAKSAPAEKKLAS